LAIILIMGLLQNDGLGDLIISGPLYYKLRHVKCSVGKWS